MEFSFSVLRVFSSVMLDIEAPLSYSAASWALEACYCSKYYRARFELFGDLGHPSLPLSCHPWCWSRDPSGHYVWEIRMGCGVGVSHPQSWWYSNSIQSSTPEQCNKAILKAANISIFLSSSVLVFSSSCYLVYMWISFVLSIKSNISHVLPIQY